MTGQDFWKILEWSDKYLKALLSNEPESREALLIKMNHAVQVGLEARRIAISLDLSSEMIELSDTAGLLHDIGRYEQYIRYRTFLDHRSVDHGKLGATILKEQKVLEKIDHGDAECILYVIENHNCYSLPPDCPDDFVLTLKIIRDADKIDILRIITESFENKKNGGINALELDLPKKGKISLEISKAVQARQPVKIKDVKNLNDFKMLLLSWVFDLNFQYTFNIMRERRYLEKIRNSLPSIENVDALFSIAEKYFNDRSVFDKKTPNKQNVINH